MMVTGICLTAGFVALVSFVIYKKKMKTKPYEMTSKEISSDEIEDKYAYNYYDSIK